MLLHLFLQSRDSQNELAGLYKGWIRLRITEIPVDNQADWECGKFLSKLLNTVKTNKNAVQSTTSRSKIP